MTRTIKQVRYLCLQSHLCLRVPFLPGNLSIGVAAKTAQQVHMKQLQYRLQLQLIILIRSWTLQVEKELDEKFVGGNQSKLWICHDLLGVTVMADMSGPWTPLLGTKVVPLPAQYKCISSVLPLTIILSNTSMMPMPTPPAFSMILKFFRSVIPCGKKFKL